MTHRPNAAEVIVLEVTMVAKVAPATELEAVLHDVVHAARQCAGCLRYDWYRAPDHERGYFAYGEFESAAAFADYRQGPVVRLIVEQLIPLLETRPSFTHFRASVMERG